MSPVSEVEGYCLRWNNHHGTLVDVLQSLYHEQSFVDVTLAAEGQHIQVHRLVLCACSDYFQELLTNDWDKQAIIFLKDVPFSQLKALVNYMYKGEVSIAEDQLDGLLSTAESLKIKGLTDNDRRMNSTEQTTTGDELAESLRINQIGPGMTEEGEEEEEQTCDVSLVGQNSVVTMQNTMSMPLFATNNHMAHQLHQPMFASAPMAQQQHQQTNGGDFNVEPKLETDNEASAAVSENDDWSESDLTAPATPHEVQPQPPVPVQHLAGPVPHQQQHQHHPTPGTCTPAPVAVQTFTTATTPFPHVPWSESLAVAAAAAIASTSTIPGPGPSVLHPASYSMPPNQPPIQPPVTPTRGKQRNSRRPSRTPNTNPVPDKPYVCNRCGRSYSRRGALIQHQRYECGVEPQFSCPMCPYKIKRKDSLNRHIRNMHHNQNTN